MEGNVHVLNLYAFTELTQIYWSKWTRQEKYLLKRKWSE